MNARVACTIAAANYLPFVRVLARSFREHNPGTPLVVLLLAGERERAAAREEGLSIIGPNRLNVHSFAAMRRRYDRKQLCAAFKPALLRHLLESGHGSAMFLDPDILVTRDLAPVFATVADHALTLTPHISNPSGSFARFGKQYLLRAGMYNAGFVGIRDCEESRRFLAWWEARLRTHCLATPEDGINYDQRWLDHAIGFVADLHILRDPGCNVAYWNMQDLEWSVHASGYRVNGMPLRFFHFSGFDPSAPSQAARYVPELAAQPLGLVGKLFQDYAALLREAGYRDPG